MTRLISFPFRVDPTGSVAARDDSDVEYLGEELAQLIQTHPGERELVPLYGLNDPAYAGLDAAMLTGQVSLFGPPVQITKVESRPLNDTQTDVVVYFDRATRVSGRLGEALVDRELRS